MSAYVAPGGPLRQSLARSFDACPQRAKWEAETPDFTTGPQALGTALHLTAEEILRTLKQTGERQMPTEEAMVVMREVLARPEAPHLSTEQQRDLRIMVLMFAAHEWTAHRIVGIEDRLMAEIPCPDGVARTYTGSPDVLIADPPGGALIVDLKSGWATPPAPRDGDWSREGGRPYLSERGVFQLDSYGYLVMRSYPAIERVTLREMHVRVGDTREATLARDELEHVEHGLGLLLMRLEKTLTGELAPEARAGRWCSHCPRPEDCPIPKAERGEGAITDADYAREVAARYAVIDGWRGQDRKALKAWVDEQGNIPLGHGYFGWREVNGKRSLGVHDRPSDPEG